MSRRRTVTIIGAAHVGATDSDCRVVNSGDLEKVERFIDYFPELTNNLTKPQIAERLATFLRGEKAGGAQ
jgi:hypothetical protein